MNKLLGVYINRLNFEIKKIGFQKYLQRLLSKSGSKTTIIRNKETERILKNNPVILISNHPNEFDPLALIVSIPERKDFFIIFTHIFTGIIDAFDKHLIPVYVQHDTKQLIPGKKVFFRMIHDYPIFTPDEEHKKNITSIKKAAKKIDHGSLVVITPSGRSKKIKWYSGIGHLINAIKTGEKVYIVFVNIQGTSRFDFLRFFPKGGKFLSEITLTFSKAKTVKKFSTKDPKTITKLLENEYKKWVEKI